MVGVQKKFLNKGNSVKKDKNTVRLEKKKAVHHVWNR